MIARMTVGVSAKTAMAATRDHSTLSTSNLNFILNELVDWETFAGNLRGITQRHIDIVKRENTTISQQKSAIFDKWIRVCPDALWKDVATALEKAEENGLAQKVAYKYLTADHHAFAKPKHSSSENESIDYQEQKKSNDQPTAYDQHPPTLVPITSELNTDDIKKILENYNKVKKEKEFFESQTMLLHQQLEEHKQENILLHRDRERILRGIDQRDHKQFLNLERLKDEVKELQRKNKEIIEKITNLTKSFTDF